MTVFRHSAFYWTEHVRELQLWLQLVRVIDYADNKSARPKLSTNSPASLYFATPYDSEATSTRVHALGDSSLHQQDWMQLEHFFSILATK